MICQRPERTGLAPVRSDSPLALASAPSRLHSAVPHPARQAPGLEQVHGIVHVPTDVEHEVLPDDAHEVGADHAHVVVGGVVAQVGVDGGKPLGHGPGALQGGLLDQKDADAGGIGPAAGLEGGAAGAHAAADDEHVHVFFHNVRFGQGKALRGIVCGNGRHGLFPFSGERARGAPSGKNRPASTGCRPGRPPAVPGPWPGRGRPGSARCTAARFPDRPVRVGPA